MQIMLLPPARRLAGARGVRGPWTLVLIGCAALTETVTRGWFCTEGSVSGRPGILAWGGGGLGAPLGQC